MDAKIAVVLGHPQFAEEVGLTRSQSQRIQTIDKRPLTEKESKALSLDPLHPKTLKLVGCMAGEIINATLQEILSSHQYQRFQEVMLQVYGIPMVVVYDECAERLRLSDKQMLAIQRIVRYYENQRRPMINAIGRYSIGGSTGYGDMMGSEDSKAWRLVREVEKLSRQMDCELLNVLAESQREAWKELQGEPLDWRWPEESITAYDINWAARIGQQ